MGFTYFTFIKYTAVVIALLHRCVADRFPPPRNLSYEWIDEFQVNVSWQKPAGVDQCNVSYIWSKYIPGRRDDSRRITACHYLDFITTEEMGSTGINYNIKTTNSGTTNDNSSWNNSKPLTISFNRQDELVTDFTCFFYTINVMNCSWKPVKQFQDLKVFYRLSENSAANSDKNLSPCEDHYSTTTRHGCYLKGEFGSTEVFILVNGTYQGRTVRNTFSRLPHKNVKPPPPTLNVTEKGDKLILSWNPPDIRREKKECWSYIVNYTKCNEPMQLLKVEDTSVKVTYVQHCHYEIQIQAVFEFFCGEGKSDLSEVVTYETRIQKPTLLFPTGTNDWSWTVAAIVIPAILSACIILSCYCLRRHKAIICPIVPDPSVIFKEMMMNRSKEPMSTTGNLYTPVLEIVESCKLTPALEDGPTSAKLFTDTHTDL